MSVSSASGKQLQDFRELIFLPAPAVLQWHSNLWEVTASCADTMPKTPSNLCFP